MPWSALLMSEITPVETWQPQISDMGIIVFLKSPNFVGQARGSLSMSCILTQASNPRCFV